jgi:hypothetical protein
MADLGSQLRDYGGKSMSRQKNYLCYNELKAGIECCYGWQWAAFYPEVDQRIEEVLQKFGAAWDVGIGSSEALSLEDDDFLTELRDHAPGKAAALLKRVARIWGVPERKLATLERSVFPLHSLRQYVVEDEQKLLKAMH